MMIQKTITKLLLAGLLLLSSLVSAQAPASADILYLKDGSVIRGTLIESITGSHVRFRNMEGEVHEYPMAEVSDTKIRARDNYPSHEPKPIGFSHISSIGAIVRSEGYHGDLASPSLQMINGVRIGNHWSTGIGIGLEDFGCGMHMPVFAHGRYSPLKGAISPYIEGMVGYVFSLISPYNSVCDAPITIYEGGITAGLGAGFKMMTGQRFGLTMGLGYRQRVESGRADTYFYPVAERINMNGIDLRFGILFN